MKYKDPTTGDFKELKIRATDELPVGSEIDVADNTTIPAGWEQTDDTKTGFSYISGGVGGTEEIFVKDLKFRTIMVTCANSGTTYGVDYSSIPGTVVTSFIVSSANTQSNANINYLVPLGSSTNMKIAQIKSNHSAGQTQVYIGVFYYPAD